MEDTTLYHRDWESGTKPLISSLRLIPQFQHARVGVWNRGGCSGELVVNAADAAEIAERLLPPSQRLGALPSTQPLHAEVTRLRLLVEDIMFHVKQAGAYMDARNPDWATEVAAAVDLGKLLDPPVIHWTRELLDKFKLAYAVAVARHEEEFSFDAQPLQYARAHPQQFVTRGALDLINYLEDQLP